MARARKAVRPETTTILIKPYNIGSERKEAGEDISHLPQVWKDTYVSLGVAEHRGPEDKKGVLA